MATKNASKPVNLGGLDILEGFDNLNFGGLIEGAGMKAGGALASTESTGERKYAKTEDVLEAPHQVRKRFNLDELRASVRENKAAGREPIKTPLIVRKHPTMPAKWEICDGARRKRTAVLENVDRLPIVVDEDFDDFDQVSVNLQRDDNTPVEIADFIARKMKEGFKKGDIAKRLGQSKSWVSKHVKLIDMPDSIRRAYDEFRLNDVEAIYLLVNAYSDFAAEVDALCATGTETISKYTVMNLIEELRTPLTDGGGDMREADAGDGAVIAPHTPDARAEDAPLLSAVGGGTDLAEQRPAVGDEAVRPPRPVLAAVAEPGAQQGAKPGVRLVEKPVTKLGSDASELRRAVVQIEHDMRPARLLLDRRAAVGLAWIRYDDDGAEIEIDVGTARLVAVVEGA